MNENLKSYLLLAVLIVGGFFAVFGLSGFLENNRPAPPDNYTDEDLALQGAKLKGFALGFEGLIADWYWMNSLQYLGDKILNAKTNFSIDNLTSLNPRLLYPYLNNATDLDPNFISVYEFGATVLPAIDQQQAIKLTQKGIDNNPDNWRLYNYLAYIYWRLKDYDKAAEVYEKGSQVAGAPVFMKSMAAQMKSSGGDLSTARVIYQQMFDQAQDEQTKENAALRLAELDSLAERQEIRLALQNFKSKTGRCAENWREILPLLQSVKLPNNRDFRVDDSNNILDPSDAPYVLDRGNCDVKLDLVKSKILPN